MRFWLWYWWRFRGRLLGSENEDSTILQNIRTCLPNNHM